MGVVGWRDGVKVSCIIPTRGRPLFALRALDCAMSQRWPSVEVIILDDLDSPSFAVPPSFDGVHYHVSERRMLIGEKRNRCCELASGELIAHFDDDDFSCPDRLADQVDRLVSTGAQVTGYSEIVFQKENGDCWLHWGDPERYALGTSLLYRRAFWDANRFQNVEAGEDTLFLGRAVRAGCLVTAPANRMMLARIHDKNTVTKAPVNGIGWKRIEGIAA